MKINLSTKELNNAAFDKAQAKIYSLKDDIIRQENDVRTGGDGMIPIDLMKKCLDASRRQLAIWEHIDSCLNKTYADNHEIWKQLQTKYD